jgi:heptosyltransferase II
MRVLIELPTWLGDTVMVTPSIESLIRRFNNTEITIIGSYASIEILKYHPNVVEYFVIEKNYFKLYKLSKKIGKFDKFLSFRGSFRSTILKFFISGIDKFQFQKSNYKNLHQVEKYSHFVNDSFGVNFPVENLKIYSISDFNNKNKTKPIIGMNPGASYGSSKRWPPQKFAKVAIELSSFYDIVIFGNSEEIEIGIEIEEKLLEKNIKNYQNLIGKTTLEDLIKHIKRLDLFLTGDSGPMHLAAAFQIPTVSIFGPTKVNETSQWMNKKNTIVKKNLKCQPCMKRKCPLIHNNCMNLINPDEVLSAIRELN